MKNLLLLASVGMLIFSACQNGTDCEIGELEVEIGECSCSDAYELTIDFNYVGNETEYFEVFARNNEQVGIFKLSDLPISIDKFEVSGKQYDFIKICLDENTDCCEELEFMSPDCEPEEECAILEVIAEVGDCNDDGTYVIELDFTYENADNDFFEIIDHTGEIIGYYELDELPIRISNFSPRDSDYDFLKVCINDNPDCCYEIEFMQPDCLQEECEIFDLQVDTGDCVGEDYYELNINFEYSNPTHPNFEVFVRDDIRIGNYSLDELPLKLEEFKTSGKDYDYIKVCMSDDPDCCEVIEFMPPSCLWEECEVFDIVTEVGDCNADGTYPLTIDFEYKNPGNDFFEIFVRNGVFVSYHRLDELPITLNNFEKSGNDDDYIKICINDVPDCCIEHEYMPPDC